MIGGVESPLPTRDGGNRFFTVYLTMLLQICRDYPGLPDARELRASQIRLFYHGLRRELIKYG